MASSLKIQPALVALELWVIGDVGERRSLFFFGLR